MARRLATDTLIYGLSNGINKSIPLLLLPLLTRYLTPAEYGITSMFTVMLTIYGVFIGLSVHGAVFNKTFITDPDYDISLFIGNCLILLAISALGGALATYFFQHQIERYSGVPPKWLWCALLAAAFQFVILVKLSSLQARGKPSFYGLVQTLQSGLNFGLSLILVVGLGWGLAGRLWGITFGIFGTALACLYWLRKDQLFTLKIRKTYLKQALEFGVPLIPHALGGMFISMTDRFLFTNFYSLQETGVYTAALQIGMVILFFSDSFNKAYVPWLFENLKKDQKLLKCRVVRITYVYFILILLMGVTPSLLPDRLWTLLLGKEFSGATIYLFWIPLGWSFNGMYYMVCNYLFYLEKTFPLSLVTATTGGLNLLLSYMLMLKNGPIGIAQGTAISFAVSFLVTWMVSQYFYPMPWLKALQRHPQN